jgi:anaerobic magnesium-protoporphyrin IX monomethyl ester cyclase
MHIVLIGADFEENLALCMLSAAVERAGHRAKVVAFDDDSQLDAIAGRVARDAPDVVGLSIQFQHRSSEFLRLATRLRSKGYRGHVTCGGQFPTMAWQHVLAGQTPFDSVALNDAEETLVELLRALERGTALAEVAGLAVPSPLGPRRTPPRRNQEDLDALPVAKRYRRHALHAGVPFIPILGGRGCWGSCTYCSITSFYRDGQASAGGGKIVRTRSARSVAQEMAVLWHAAGGAGIFCFHDDNFLLPRPEATRERVGALRAALDELGVGRAAIVGKARPDCIDAALAKDLARWGVVRLYVGVENASASGAEHLGRRKQNASIRQALAACREAGIFTCYNLLLFEPDTTLEDVRENVAFMREHAVHPVNFCRAEPYHGTPLYRRLEREGRLRGSVLGWDYRLADDRAELLFRICASAFRERNFASAGVANRTMGLGYVAKVVAHFHPDDARVRPLERRAAELTRAISEDTADWLEKAIELAARADLGDRDRIERDTALLGLGIAAADRVWHARLDAVIGDIEDFAARARTRSAPRKLPQPIARLAETLGLAAVVGMGTATFAQGCGSTTVDPVPSDAGQDWSVSDPVPQDAGIDAQPNDAGSDADATVVDPPPPDAGVGLLDDDRRPTDHWRDTAPRRAVRSDDVPLFDPPDVRLSAVREGDAVRVTLVGGPAAIGTRWQAEGDIDGDGREVVWRPSSDADLLSVAVRGRGGVSVVSIRTCEV